MGKNLSFCNYNFRFLRVAHSWNQPNLILIGIDTNVINRDKHLAYTLFWLDKIMPLLVQFSFKIVSKFI